MSVIRKNSCNFHSDLASRSLLLSRCDQVLFFDYNQPIKETVLKLQGVALDLVRNVHKMQELLICGGCLGRLKRGERVTDQVLFTPEFRLIEGKGKVSTF